MDVGSAENAWSDFQPTTMDGGSADIAYVHGWTVLGQRICTGRTESELEKTSSGASTAWI